MKRGTSLFLAIVIGVLLILPFTKAPFNVSVNAANEEYLTFTLNKDGESYSVGCSNKYISGDIVIPSTYNGLPVTVIREEAFIGCDSITSVTISEGIKTIGFSAFSQCDNLRKVELPESLTSIGHNAFNFCANLTTLNLPSNLTEIGRNIVGNTAYYNDPDNWTDGMLVPDGYVIDINSECTVCSIGEDVKLFSYNVLDNCTMLEEISVNENNSVFSSVDGVLFNKEGTTLIKYPKCKSETEYTVPDTVEFIGEQAFSGSVNLTSINIPDGVESVGDNAFSSCTGIRALVIPNSVNNIGKGAFVGCTNLETVNLPDGITHINEYVFQNCSSLITVNIPESVTCIGSGAFLSCKKLEHIVIPEGVTDIDDCAFMYCNNLESVNIPDGVTHIGQQAFRDCVKITDFSIPDSVRDIETTVFFNTGYYNNSDNWSNGALYIDEFLISVEADYSGLFEVRDGTLLIAETAFRWCENITSVTIPDSVLGIGGDAFFACSSLSSVCIPNSVTYIGDSAFRYCENLTTVKLSDSLEKISYATFAECDSLTTIELPDNLKSIEDFAFSRCTELKNIIIPDSVLNIEAAAFDGSGLENVIFEGNKNQWDNITIDEYNEPLINANKIFADTKPQTPKTLSKNAVGGVEVYWEPVLGAVKYNVYRRAAGQSNWTLVGTTTGTSIKDKNVTSGTYYRYSVRAYNAYGIYSDYVYGLTNLRKYMATPKLTGISNSTNGIYIKWNAVSGVTNGYRVYRRGAGSKYWTYLGTTKNTYWTDSGVKNASGGYYRYTVIADGGYHSAFDTTGLYTKRLSNPTLKSATSSSLGVTVKWSTVKDATGYYIYRKTGNGNWVRIAVVTPGSTSTYLDKTAQKGVTYTYTVRAVCGKYISYFDSGLKVTDKY